MKTFHPLALKRRGERARWALFGVLGVLGFAFFQAQILRTSTWRLRSDSNRLRPLPIVSPRGTIYDRHGRTLANNVSSYSIFLLPAPLDSVRSTLDRLSPYLGLDREAIEGLVERARRNPRHPLLVDGDAGYDAVVAVEERREDFPEIVREMRPRRHYTGGSAMAHVVGYVGEITSAELESARFREYEPGMLVGREGLERRYEEILQGTQGVRYVEVDALGRVLGSFRGRPGTPPVKGGDLHLNLDGELMEWIHRIFPDSLPGAVVALNVEDGGVLALYSHPTFDPNDFVGGIDPVLWDALNEDPHRPFFNRSVSGIYPPASPWKLAVAGIALELGIVTPSEMMPLPCAGGMSFGNRYFRCWEREGHGPLDLGGAIGQSCDVYFYQLGLSIGLGRLVEAGNGLRFSDRCGIDLPGESRGRFPENLDYWRRVHGYRPTESEAMSLAIGQGPNAQTPLRMAQFYLAVARDGHAPAPQLLREVDPGPGWTLPFDETTLEILREGLRRVVEPGGTANLATLEHWDFIGKTGTAQNSLDPERDHAWFAGIAGPPGGAPEIVVVVIVEFGLSGSQTAAPLVAKISDFHLRKKYGIPIDTIQTLGEHLRAGRPAPWADGRRKQ